MRKISWNEPNRVNLPLLHISSAGQRNSSLAGVRWIDRYRFIANHNIGLRLALFDTRLDTGPVVIADTTHRTDDLDLKKVGPDLYEIVVSGCWDAAYSLFQFIDGEEPRLEYISTKKNKDRSFSHGVSYDHQGRICTTYSTGLSPRIEIEGKSWVLPRPWGARFVTFSDSARGWYAVCTSETPKQNSYKTVDSSVWVYDPEADGWIMKVKISGVHSDSCQFYNGRLWLADQVGDRIIAVDLENRKKMEIKGEGLTFPHGLAISKEGMLAVTNYGDSSISLMDISQL